MSQKNEVTKDNGEIADPPQRTVDVVSDPQESAETEEEVKLTVVDSDADGSADLQAGSSVKSARFAPLGQSVSHGAQGSMDLLLDVDLDLTVELGRTSLPVREVLQLGPGSIVELDKLAGEPADIMVNGKLIARGEVVVVDESFGVRVTEIASQSERLSGLG